MDPDKEDKSIAPQPSILCHISVCQQYEQQMQCKSISFQNKFNTML